MAAELRTLGDAFRKEVAPLRAPLWRGRLSVAQFAERNRRLYAHPYGQESVRTFGWVRGDEVLSSLDALQIELAQVAENGVRRQKGYLVASVFTPEQNRGQGYATHLLESFLEANSGVPMVLYSDIGPDFYARWDFQATPKVAVEEPCRATTHYFSAHPLGRDAFSARFRAQRLACLSEHPTGSLLHLPSPLWWSWVEARYRYFAELANQEFSEEALYWELSAKGQVWWVAAFPNALNDCLDILWAPQDEAVLAFLRDLGHVLGLKRVHWWTSPEGLPNASPAGYRGQAQWPMARVPGRAEPAQGGAPFLDPQPVDYW